MHTVTRTLTVGAGIHELQVDYQQHGGDYAIVLGVVPAGAPLRARFAPPHTVTTFAPHRLFRKRPSPGDIRLVELTHWLSILVPVVWGTPVVLGGAFLARRIQRARARSRSLQRDHQDFGDSPGATTPFRPSPRVSLAIHGLFLALSALYCSNVFLLRDLNSHGILAGDPAVLNWQLQWVARALYTDPFNLFNGNTFHPYPNAIALTDHMLSLALINVPFRMLYDSPWVGYNLLIFLAYYLSCVGAYWFTREVTRSRWAGIWAGIFWGFLFFRIHHIGHLNVLSYQWMPFVAITLLRLLRSPTWGRTLAFSACFLAQSLVSWYFAVITSILVGVLVLAHVERQHLTAVHAVRYATALLLCAAVIVPLTIPYAASLEGSSLGDRAARTLTPGDRVAIADYLHPPRATLLGQWRGDGPWIWGEQTLYVGYTAIALALAGLIAVRFRAGTWPTRARWIVTGLVLVVLGFVLAKGFISSHNVRLPLFYLSELPGLDPLKGLHSTQRFSLLLYFGVMMLSAAGVAALTARQTRTGAKWAATVLVCGLFLAEVYPYALPFQPRRYEVSRLDRAIAGMRYDDGDRPVVLHLPIHHFLDRPFPEAIYMLDSTHHWARVVNGFSGAQPRGFPSRMAALASLPSDRGARSLAELDVDLVAIHRDVPRNQRRRLVDFFEEAPWATVYEVGDEHLVVIDRNDGESDIMGLPATRAGSGQETADDDTTP